jgi:hypothetical protein
MNSGRRGGGRLWAAIVPSLALVVGCELPPDQRAPSGPVTNGSIEGHSSANASSGTYTVVALPDTQYYAAKYPAVFNAQVTWITAEREARNIAFVVHEGDLVDAENATQWSVASDSMDVLADAGVPYVLSMGNHDYSVGPSGWPTGRSTMIDQYFPVSRFSSQWWFFGTFDPAHIENNYAVFTVPGTHTRWLVVSLEFGPRDEVLVWANGVLAQHADLPAIVVTHAYLYEDGTRYDHQRRPAQKWNPHAYPIDVGPGSVNDGEEIWQKLVSANSNVRFVLCGHVLGKGTGRSTSTRADGTVVHEILANYQMLKSGGDGFLRIMTFDPQARFVHVSTFSPYIGEWKTDTENDFFLDLQSDDPSLSN